MRKLPLLFVLAVGFSMSALAQDVTGLAGWNIFLDPGHSRTENQGAFGYSEAENVVRVGLRLREMLLTETDIDTVYISRTDDVQLVGLSQRTDHANEVAAAFFHSIHSNAAAPHVNHVFVLWAQLRDLSEPAPPYNGGKRMAEFMGPRLGQGMRIPLSNNGAWGECAFYGVTSCGTGPKGSRNFVQRNSLMPSALSEAGFHTNPTQNQLKMNADWKRLEARAMLWSIYQYHDIPRPVVSIATGIIRDIENGLPINGATITIGDRTYTTDTFASLFHQYSSDPDALRNGFFYLEDLPKGTLEVVVEAEGYLTHEGTIATVDDFFTFYDVQLISTVPPVVSASNPAQGAEAHRVIDPIVIDFSRRMDRASVEQAFSISPEVGGSFLWQASDTRLVFQPDSLVHETDYQVVIAGSAEGFYGHQFDGDGDGEPGGDFVLTFTTGFPDMDPPRMIASSPSPGSSGVEIRPVITVTYDELIDHASIDGKVSLELAAGGGAVPGQVAVYDVGEQSVVSFFPDVDLAAETSYRFAVEPGVRDLFLNEQTLRQQFLFTTGAHEWVVTAVIDDFDGNFTGNWWDPQQSGSTAGIITDSTYRRADTDVVNLLTESSQSMQIQYGWDLQSSPHLIRVHLGGGAPRNVTFGHDDTMQAYVFGDGGGSQFAFSVRDARSTSAPVGRSPWFTIDWRGWRLVSWDIGEHPPVVWAGTGEFGPPYFMESLQMRYASGADQYGEIYVDDLRLARSEPFVSQEPVAGTPDAFRIHQNYPNPFSSTTTLSFDLAAPSPVSVTVYNVVGAEVARLVDGETYAAGRHELVWDASALSSGVYIVHVVSQGASGSQKVLLVR